MGETSAKISYFVKDEASFGFTNKNLGNYTGVGLKCNNNNGTTEALFAFKASDITNNTSLGAFGEFKYTTPKIADSDFAIESRTRIIYDKPLNNDKHLGMITQRVAGKYSRSFNDFNVYEILGAQTKLSLNDGNLKSITPTSLTGVGYNITDKINIYAELELSKPYDFTNNNWDNFSSGAYLGFKMTF